MVDFGSPYKRFWINAEQWISRTRRLSAHEKAVYIDLMCDSSMHGPINDSDLAKMFGDQRSIDFAKDVLSKCFTLTDSGWVNALVDSGRIAEKERTRPDLATSKWATIRVEVLNRDNWICGYCGKSLEGSDATVDHIIPFSKGGGDDQSNLVAACRGCNARKKDSV